MFNHPTYWLLSLAGLLAIVISNNNNIIQVQAADGGPDIEARQGAPLSAGGGYDPRDPRAAMSANIALIKDTNLFGELGKSAPGSSEILKHTKLVGAPNIDNDIEEDPNDRFITSRSGKLREIKFNDADDADQWANERPMASTRLAQSGPSLHSGSAQPVRVLSRKKRCGGNDDDDDGDANRARGVRGRRGRRTSRTRRRGGRRRGSRRRASKSTTTVTRRVIQNGQVVSETTSESGAKLAPVAQAAAPVVQSIVPQQQVIPAPVGQQTTGNAVPSISVQGAVKIN